MCNSQHVPALAPWWHLVKKGQTLRIIDLEGNQAADFLTYNAHDRSERYDAQVTIAMQENVYLRTGSVLYSNDSNPMMTITQTNVEYHDTIGGACSVESNALRYGHFTKSQHACVDNFIFALANENMGKRDMTSNINWFMNVLVLDDGALGIVDGISAPGKYVDLIAHMDVMCVISNCPQINNPCNGFHPTPVQCEITTTPPPPPPSPSPSPSQQKPPQPSSVS